MIGILFAEPSVRLHLREIARRAGLSAPTIAQELAQLKRAGVVRAEAIGNQLHFSADDSYPLAPELRLIAAKTWGVIGRLREALNARQDIEVAFVFGSHARGEDRAGSDIDVLVIGKAPYGELSELASTLSAVLRRTVSLKLYRRAEWNRKLAESNPFVAGVAKESRIYLVGGEEELRGKAGTGSDARKGLGPEARSGKGGNRRPSPGRSRLPSRR